MLGGLCPTVGVAGFTLGGGFNWMLSRYYGIAVDNVISMQVVLATGEIVTVTYENEYRDLMWGMLGSGGSQLAMALEFTMKIHKEQAYTRGALSYTFGEKEGPGVLAFDQLRPIYHKLIEVADSLRDNDQIGAITVSAARDMNRGSSGYSAFIYGVCVGCNFN